MSEPSLREQLADFWLFLTNPIAWHVKPYIKMRNEQERRKQEAIAKHRQLMWKMIDYVAERNDLHYAYDIDINPPNVFIYVDAMLRNGEPIKCWVTDIADPYYETKKMHVLITSRELTPAEAKKLRAGEMYKFLD